MVEKNVNKCDKHDLGIERFIQRNEDGTIESVDACKKCALILKGAGLKLEKAPAKAGQEGEKGPFGIDKETLKKAEEEYQKHFSDDEEHYWDK